MWIICTEITLLNRMIHLRWQDVRFEIFIRWAAATRLWISGISREYFQPVKCWNDSTGALLFAARLKYLFVALAFSAWQKRPAASTTAGMATIRAFQNGSRWSCQKRKQQKICLVTELHRRAGDPPEAPTEPLAYYPSLFTSFLHSFFIITAPLISLFPDYKVFILIR